MKGIPRSGVNKGWIKKGQKLALGVKCSEEKKELLKKINTGKRASPEKITKMKLTKNFLGKKHSKHSKEKISKNRIGKHCGQDHHEWKGVNAGYVAKHMFIKLLKGKPKKCKKCGSEKNVWWANVDHKYSRNPDDYIEMCAKCHHAFDVKFNNKKVRTKKL